MHTRIELRNVLHLQFVICHLGIVCQPAQLELVQLLEDRVV
jgi:hypothetical protein